MQILWKKIQSLATGWFQNFSGSWPTCKYCGSLENHWIKVNIMY